MKDKDNNKEEILTIHQAVITGATGMIGLALIQYLLSRNIEVTACVRPDSPRKKAILEHPLLHIAEIDLESLAEEESISKLLMLQERTDRIDAFFHLGWEGTFGASRNDMYLQNRNIQYTLDAVKLANKLSCHVFVGAGSQAEYGRVNGIKLAADTPTFPENGYGIAKLAAGQMSRILCREYGIRHEWTRILSVYGPYDGKNTMVMSAVGQLIQRKRPSFSKGEQLWDYLYAQDAARALYLIAEQGKNERIYPIGGGQTKPLKEYIQIIRDSIDPSLDIGLGELPYNDRQVMYLCADIAELTEDTGFLPKIPFEEGIRETIAWYKRVNNNENN